MEQTGNQPVPLHLRNAPTQLMSDLGYGADYQYPHDYPGHFVRQQYMPDELTQLRLWEPQDNPAERKLSDYLGRIWGEQPSPES